MLAIAIILLYSYLGSVNAGLNPAITVRPENETLQANDTEDSIEVFESLGYAPDNLPYLDPTLPFVGKEGDVNRYHSIKSESLDLLLSASQTWRFILDMK